MAAVTPMGLRVDGVGEPVAVGNPTPRLSWRLDAGERRDVVQTAFQVRVFDGDEPLWDTGRVAARTMSVRYAGPRLRSRGRYRWQARAWDPTGAGNWSAYAHWEMGLLDPADWTARWIRAPEPETDPDVDGVEPSTPAPLVRNEFTLDDAPLRARLYATALGLYELRLNGTRVGDQVLAPGWTDYRRRIQYQVYDVTATLRAGRNAVGALLGDGWYCGHVAFFGRRIYGDFPAFLAQLEVVTADGGRVTVASDASWRTAPSGVVSDDLVMGEREDGRAWPGGWDLPGFDDRGWAAVRLQAPPGGELVAQLDAGTAVVDTLTPVATAWQDGRCIVDFGQNMVGRVSLDVEAAAGTEVTVRHGEALDADADLYTANLRSAAQEDAYTSSGRPDRFEPRFTFHGFRYAEVSGLRELAEDRVRGQVISAALEPTGDFSCSDPMLDQLQRNIVWGQRGNFVSVPTDCPQRDERLGWAADAQVFAPTAAFNMNVLPFFRKWLIDLEDAQLPSGAYTDIAPTGGGWSGAGNAGWSDAGIVVPWCLYVRYGAIDVLERHYPSMRRYLAYLVGDSTGLIRSAGRYGDWLSLEGPTPKDVVGTAYFAHCADLLGRIAEVLGDERATVEYAALHRSIRDAFVEQFVEPDGAIAGHTQTGQILALQMGLLPSDLVAPAAQRLAEYVEARDAHLATGFLGTPLALPTLSDHGHHELACRIAQQDTFPSWGFQVKHGATTIWERWDGWTPERGFQDERMNSFNHYAFGSIGDWLYRYVGGLAPDPACPGYGHARIQPRPGGTLRWARLAHDSPYGRWEVSWELVDGTLTLDVTVPANATADVILGGRTERVGSGRHRLRG